MEAIHVFNHCTSFMRSKLIEEAADTLVYALSPSCGVTLGLWAVSLIATIPFAIISHLDKMYCSNAGVGVLALTEGLGRVTAPAGCEKAAGTHQSRYWLTESFVASRQSITTLDGESPGLNLEATEPASSSHCNLDWFTKALLTSFCLSAPALGFSVNASRHVKDMHMSFIILFYGDRAFCAAGPDSPLITCQWHIKSNMDPFTTGTCHVSTVSEVCNTHYILVTCWTYTWWRGQGWNRRVLISHTLGHVLSYMKCLKKSQLKVGSEYCMILHWILHNTHLYFSKKVVYRCLWLFLQPDVILHLYYLV